MNQRIRNIVFTISGILLLSGAALYITRWAVAPYLFAIGAAGITVCHLTTPTSDLDFRQKRLHRFNVISGILMVCASGFMFKDRTEWLLLLAISAIFQVYTAFVDRKKS